MSTRLPIRRARDRRALTPAQNFARVNARAANQLWAAGVLSFTMNQPLLGSGSIVVVIDQWNGIDSINSGVLSTTESGGVFSCTPTNLGVSGSQFIAYAYDSSYIPTGAGFRTPSGGVVDFSVVGQYTFP